MTDLYCELLGRMCAVKLYRSDLQAAVLGGLRGLVLYFTHFRLWPSRVASGQCLVYSLVTLYIFSSCDPGDKFSGSVCLQSMASSLNDVTKSKYIRERSWVAQSLEKVCC